ncbi:MAG: protein kinase [Pseudomonadota bacterium]|nr:protein kinase [Pseudomonadota bacterium]
MNPSRRYEVRGLLGEGAFGAVYLARAVGGGIQREVAIKVLHRDKANSPAIVGRLRDEARMLALIRHRSIVRVDDLVELDGNWSIVMEYVEGCDIAALLREGALAPSVAIAVAEEVANALHAAWTQAGTDGRPLRLIHRDIKPGNVRLTAQGEVKLLDFGVARAEFAEREAGTTQTGFGTLTYMAPERFEGKDSHESDMYALGVFLFEMLTGVSPGKTAADRDRQPPGRRYAEQWAYLAGVSTDLHVIVAGLLAYEPERRPAARDCARALADIRGQLRGERLEDWAARTVPAVLAEGRVAPQGDPRTGTILTERSGTATTVPERKGVRLLPWLAGGVVSFAAFVVVVLVAGIGAWWVLRPAPIAPPPVAVVAPVALPSPAPSKPAEAPTGTGKPASPTRPKEEPRATTRTPAPPVQPAPKAAVTPAPTASAEGRLRLAGDPVDATFTGPNGKVAAGSVPAGTYTAQVTFASGTAVTIRNVVVSPGRVTWLTCKADFGNCSSSQE